MNSARQYILKSDKTTYSVEVRDRDMEKEVVTRLHAQFESMVCSIVDSHSGSEIECWLARDLQEVLGYSQWRSFSNVIDKAITSCEKAGYDAADHFAQVRRMVDLGSGSKREIEDIGLSRYACYLIAQNGDPSKAPIAFAQAYFAAQTRKQEIVEKRLAEVERLSARKELTASEKELSDIIYERLDTSDSFGRIRSKGDKALFGGKTTKQMKDHLQVPKNRPLADFLPTITIKAKDFANEITNFNIKQRNLGTETHITEEHVKNNADVRKLLRDRHIVPEELPPAEDVKKIERRLKSEVKKLPKDTGTFKALDS